MTLWSCRCIGFSVLSFNFTLVYLAQPPSPSTRLTSRRRKTKTRKRTTVRTMEPHPLPACSRKKTSTPTTRPRPVMKTPMMKSPSRLPQNRHQRECFHLSLCRFQDSLVVCTHAYMNGRNLKCKKKTSFETKHPSYAPM